MRLTGESSSRATACSPYFTTEAPLRRLARTVMNKSRGPADPLACRASIVTVVTDKTDLELVSGLYRTTNAVVRELDQRLSREHGVTFVQALTLLAVDSIDTPQPHLVADHLAQQSQTVTGVLDRLERLGHITRRRDLGDRRAVRLQLTPTGKALVNAVNRTLAGHLTDVLEGSRPGERPRITSALEAIERGIRHTAS